MGSVQRVSVHGGHSGEFCCHAADSLEEIVVAYLVRGFDWVGITEHIPPVDDRFRYPEEIEAGLRARQLYGRFERYIATCRRLQQKYVQSIQLYVGFETEACSGAIPFIRDLARLFEPDYIVGSVHHVDDIGFDFSRLVRQGRCRDRQPRSSLLPVFRCTVSIPFSRQPAGRRPLRPDPDLRPVLRCHLRFVFRSKPGASQSGTCALPGHDHGCECSRHHKGSCRTVSDAIDSAAGHRNGDTSGARG